MILCQPKHRYTIAGHDDWCCDDLENKNIGEDVQRVKGLKIEFLSHTERHDRVGHEHYVLETLPPPLLPLSSSRSAPHWRFEILLREQDADSNTQLASRLMRLNNG